MLLGTELYIFEAKNDVLRSALANYLQLYWTFQNSNHQICQVKSDLPPLSA